MEDRVPVKLEKSSQQKCFFDPHKACGSHSRSKLAYQRKLLLKQAQKCGIPGATSLSLDALCLLMRELYFENLKKKMFLEKFQEFNLYEPNSYLSIPVELGGNLTVSNARLLKQKKHILKDIDNIINSHNFDQRKLTIFKYIFFPNATNTLDVLSSQEISVLKTFNDKVNYSQ